MKGPRFYNGVSGVVHDRSTAVGPLGGALPRQAEGANGRGYPVALERAEVRGVLKLAGSSRQKGNVSAARDMYILLSKCPYRKIASAARKRATSLSVLLIQTSGDQAPFEWLVASQQDSLTGLFRWMLGGEDLEEIHDLKQLSFLAAWRRIKQLRDPRLFIPWLRGVARNVGRDYLRQRKRRLAGLRGLAKEFRRRKKGGSAGGFQELLEIVPDLMDREILHLRFEEGLTYPQIASELEIGINADAIRKRVDKAERLLKEELERLTRDGTEKAKH